MATLYHGSHNNLMGTNKAHEGMCLTDDQTSAEAYAGNNGTVYMVEIPSSMIIQEVTGYDRETNEAPADDESFRSMAFQRGIDIITYTDEDENGAEHECWRLVSIAAVEFVSANIKAAQED